MHTHRYTTCAGLLTASSSTWPESALFQIAANGVTLDKLVIGKPAVAADETAGGFIDPATLATCVEEAKSEGWTAGVMSWGRFMIRSTNCHSLSFTEYPDAAAAWIAEVRADSWPV